MWVRLNVAKLVKVMPSISTCYGCLFVRFHEFVKCGSNILENVEGWIFTYYDWNCTDFLTLMYASTNDVVNFIIIKFQVVLCHPNLQVMDTQL